jgi:hypothetical protein
MSRTGDVPKKQLHLVSDAGFVRSTVRCLVLEVALLYAAYSYAPLRFWAVDMYESIKLKMLGFAHYMAWWSMLGLLSSACCVLQILLNAFSFGCAGFNTVLGPLRPPLIAFTLIAQSISWWVAFPLPFQWGPTAATTALSLFFTFSPELLYVVNKRRAETAARGAKASSASDRTARSLARMAFEPNAMGCISCVNKVSKTLAAHSPLVVGYSVSLASASADVLLSPENDDASSLARRLVDEVVAAGFPAKLAAITPATPEDIARISDPGQAGRADEEHKAAGNSKVDTCGTFSLLVPWMQCVVGGLLGSSCCLIQLGANLLASLNVAQIGCTGFNKVLGPMRPQVETTPLEYP